ncbi:patatin-like phospholipase family protein [Haloglomus litoreum]|uniref:patatin-like phospholipase family protein n=1 Tax=Haloglomus litoreum TaxID=3034026 RepID=UPI0023E7A8E7|nr:patatin-like phospholipase family protein [Haloglomus sp. DT116]
MSDGGDGGSREGERTDPGGASAVLDGVAADGANVAIACQGGGSHTAFTAGVLRGLLRNWREDDTLVGLSGTSGGAVNAVTAWYGLTTAGSGRACDLLDAVWDDIAAETPTERWTNDSFVWLNRVEASGFPVPRVSPYYLPSAKRAQREFREVIERHVDFATIRDLCDRGDYPHLVVGTVDINGGEFETFTDQDITAEAVLASAAVPELFPAVEIHGHYHWDGLFSQNPPVRDLMHVAPERKPDELWVVQINPQDREGLPTSPDEIADRRNELSGNISLNKELRFIEQVNDWVAAGRLPESEFSQTTIRRIELDQRFDQPSKLDRSRDFLIDLMDRGEAKAEAFLAGR